MIKNNARPLRLTGTEGSTEVLATSNYNPCAIEMEQAVIGGLLLDKQSISKVNSKLEAEDFYHIPHRFIYKALESFTANDQPCDVLTLKEKLKADHQLKDVGEAYLFELMNNTPSSANIEYYAEKVKQKSLERTLLNLLDENKSQVQQGDNPHKIITALNTSLIDLQQSYSLNKPTLKTIELEDFLATELPPRELILSPWLPKAGLAMIHARPVIGKTHLSFGIAYAVASGSEFLGWKAEKPCGVLLIDGEMPAPAAQQRWAQVVAMNNCHKLPAKLCFLTPDLQSLSMPDLGTLEGQVQINALINDDIALIIVDNLSCLVRTGKENDSESWQPVQSWALSLRAKGKSVLFIHHQGKTGSQRGSSKKEDVLDSVISLKRPDDYVASQGARFIISYEKSRGFHGEDAKPFEAHLTNDRNNTPCWVTRDIEEGTYQKVITMLNDGMKQKDIAEELGINKSNVSRHTQRAKEKGLLKIGGMA